MTFSEQQWRQALSGGSIPGAEPGLDLPLIDQWAGGTIAEPTARAAMALVNDAITGTELQRVLTRWCMPSVSASPTPITSRPPGRRPPPGAGVVLPVSPDLGTRLVAARDALPAGTRTFASLTELWDALPKPGEQIAVLLAARRPGRWWRAADIALLLPLGLQTRFDQDPGGGWRMRLRVIPDRPFTVEVPTGLTRAQAVDLEQATSAIATAIDKTVEATPRGQAPDLEALRTAIGGQYLALAARHGAARAAALLRLATDRARPAPASPPAEPPAADPDSAQDISRVQGFPDRLDVWLRESAGTLIHAARISVNVRQLERWTLPEGEDQPWWMTFQGAREVGLGADIPLPNGLSPQDLDAILVTGLGPDTPDELLVGLRDGGSLGVLNPGSATNTVEGEPVTDPAATAEAWRPSLVDHLTAILLKRLAGPGAPASVSASGSSAEQLLGQALLGRRGGMAPLPGGSDRLHDQLGSAMTAAIGAAVWLNGLGDGWWGRDAAQRLQVSRWANTYLRALGPLPAVQIGHQPYGLIPTTPLAHWQPHPNEQLPHPQFAATLARIRDLMAENARAPVDPSGPPERLLQLLARTPMPTTWLAWPQTELPQDHQGWDAACEWLVQRLLSDWTVRPFYPTAAYGYPRTVTIPLVEPLGTGLLPSSADGRSLADQLTSLIADPDQYLEPDSGTFLPFSTRFAGQEYPASLLLVLVEAAWWHASTQPQYMREEMQGAVKNAVTELVAAIEGSSSDPASLVGRMEGWLAATVDVGAQRVDPWITGVAWQRLATMDDPTRAGQPASRRVGAYGWVDGPIDPRAGAPLAVPESLLHTPSTPQSLTASLLRDRVLSGDTGYALGLDSAGVRAARWLAEEVRRGASVHEALGREVERIVGVQNPELVAALRAAYPMQEAHQGRRTCDGVAVLTWLHELLDGGMLNGLTAEARADLTALNTMQSAYAGLTLADGLHSAVTRQQAGTAAAVAALAGTGRPTELRVADTPASGTRVLTTLMIALPHATDTPAAGASPRRIADPAVADYVATVVPTDLLTWTVTWQTPKPTGTTVTMADLGLEPVDLAGITIADLDRYAAGIAGHPEAGVRGPHPALVERITEIVRLLGRPTPATPADLGGDGTQGILDDLTILDDLKGRLARAQEAAKTEATAEPTTLTQADLLLLLIRLRRWGLGPSPVQDPTILTDLHQATQAITAARSELNARVPTAPPPDTPPPPDTVDGLVTQLGALVAGGGPVAVLATHPSAAIPGTFTDFPGLDAEWLAPYATVRAAVAALESHQLQLRRDGTARMSGFVSHPDDLWGKEEADARRQVVYAAEASSAPEGWAVGVLDRWTEQIPAAEAVSSAAFGFDAPSGQPPQALLLVAPPIAGVPLSRAAIVDTVLETRRLARARSARLPDLPIATAAVPLTILPHTDTSALERREDPS